MSVRRRKTNLFLYVLFLMLLASFAFYPNEAKATGTGATATEIVYNDTGQTVSEPGRLESFWLIRWNLLGAVFDTVFEKR